MSDQQPELDDSQAFKVSGRARDAGKRAKAGPAGDKVAIIHAVGVVLDEIGRGADHHYGSSQQDASLQETAHNGFETAVIHGHYTFPSNAVDDHFDSKNQDHGAKDEAQRSRARMHQHFGSHQGPGEYSKHHRHGHAWVDIPVPEI